MLQPATRDRSARVEEPQRPAVRLGRCAAARLIKRRGRTVNIVVSGQRDPDERVRRGTLPAGGVEPVSGIVPVNGVLPANWAVIDGAAPRPSRFSEAAPRSTETDLYLGLGAGPLDTEIVAIPQRIIVWMDLIARRFRRTNHAQAQAITAYCRLYDAIVESAMPPAVFKRLDYLRVDYFDGSMRPSAEYFLDVSTEANGLLQALHAADEILTQTDPPPGAIAAFGRLAALHNTTVEATEAVIAAAERGYFSALQKSLFVLTREIPLLHRSVEADHKKLRRREGID